MAVAPRSHAGVHHDRAVGAHDHRVEIDLDDLGVLLDHGCQAHKDILERGSAEADEILRVA